MALRGDRVLLAPAPVTGGLRSLPEAPVRLAERVEDACLRAFEEATGALGQIEGFAGVASEPAMDERGHVVAIGYFVRIDNGGPPPTSAPEAGSRDASGWQTLDGLPPLRSQHAALLEHALRGRRETNS